MSKRNSLDWMRAAAESSNEASKPDKEKTKHIVLKKFESFLTKLVEDSKVDRHTAVKIISDHVK